MNKAPFLFVETIFDSHLHKVESGTHNSIARNLPLFVNIEYIGANLCVVPVKKQLPSFVGVGKYFLMKSENIYPPLMNSVIL